jgi:hypothetical protein
MSLYRIEIDVQLLDTGKHRFEMDRLDDVDGLQGVGFRLSSRVLNGNVRGHGEFLQARAIAITIDVIIT